MKVVHITTIDQGGAYTAVRRLNTCLKRQGVESEIVLRTKTHEAHEGIQILSTRPCKFVSKTKNFINNLFSDKGMHIEGLGTDISRERSIKEADILVIHWINSFLSYHEIDRLCKLNKPVIWVLHDMWVFTGGCHYDHYCEKYEVGCNICGRARGFKKCAVRVFFRKKKKIFEHADIIFVGPSEWMTECAKRSRILQKKTVLYIPNVIDTNVFRVKNNKAEIQKKLQINVHKKIVIFGAADEGTENERKGFSYLKSALEYLDPQKYFLIVFGNAADKCLTLPENLERKFIGYVEREEEMVELYNVADVFANPSLQEAFGYTVCEAMACGTPVVGFAIGGVKEQIRHMENGYLARYLDAQDLARGIEYCAYNSEKLGKNARKAAEKYDYSCGGKKYIDLFEQSMEDL